MYIIYVPVEFWDGWKQPKIDFSIEDKNFVYLMACIFTTKKRVLNDLQEIEVLTNIVLGYAVRLPFNGLEGLRIRIGKQPSSKEASH